MVLTPVLLSQPTRDLKSFRPPNRTDLVAVTGLRHDREVRHRHRHPYQINTALQRKMLLSC